MSGRTRLMCPGHAMALIEASGGERLLVDPCPDGALGGAMRYGEVPAAEVVVMTHAHADHAGVSAVPGSPVVWERGRWGPFEITRVPGWHDEYAGRRRGGAVDLVVIEVDGWRLVHLGDVGQSPSAEQVAALGRVDVLMVPVGGFYTIGAAQAWEWCARLGARWVVPNHYKTARCGLGLRGVEVFEAWGPARGVVEALELGVGPSEGMWVVQSWR